MNIRRDPAEARLRLWSLPSTGASMKIVEIATLQEVGPFADSREWHTIKEQLQEAILEVCWPPGSDNFTIYPQSGKKWGEENGVTPIKLGLVKHLLSLGWGDEHPLYIAKTHNPGDLDIVTITDDGPFALEWETGNISSSHRALNKLCLGMLKGKLVGGVLIVPTRKLYKFLTDRIGNWDELVPYFDLWRSLPIANGVLQVSVLNGRQGMSLPDTDLSIES